MSIVRRLAETAADITVVSRRQASRVRLEVEIGKLHARIRSELSDLGRDVYERLSVDPDQLDISALEPRIRVVRDLESVAQQRLEELGLLQRQSAGARKLTTSMSNIDYNATEGAGLGQRARTAQRERSTQPLDEGGSG